MNAIVVPHPPLIIPMIGQGEEKKIDEIVKAYRKAAQTIIDHEPETVIIISPHAPSYFDYIQISKGKKASGDLREFYDFQDRFSIEYDQELIKEIEKICQEDHLPAGTLGKQDGKLDHGTMVPLYFLQGFKKQPKFIRIGIGGPNQQIHYQVGQAIQKAARKIGRKISIVASGDLSHCQKKGSPYGYHECGSRYDEKIMNILDKGDFLSLLQVSEKEIEEAMVCGHKSFCIMAGALDGYQVASKALSHSAEFGVGYGIVVFDALIFDANRHFLPSLQAMRQQRYRKKIINEDAYISLARKAIERYITKNEWISPSKTLPKELLEQKAGLFVSIHENDELRGCIGTTKASKKNIAGEIIHNAILAATQDPRFPRIQAWELEDLEIKVDVLKEPETILSKEELDPKKYGVIVSQGRKSGLLLPDLEGIETIEKQIQIAKEKAGIAKEEERVQLQRFEVERHE